MSIQELERRVAEAAIVKHQSPLRTEVRSDGKHYFLTSDREAWERASDALNQAVRDLIAAKEADVDTDEWPEIING